MILDLLKDGEVRREQDYNGLDASPAADVVKYGNAIATIPPGTAPTPEHLAEGLMRALRLALRDAIERKRVPGASMAAEQAARAAVRAETLAEIGE